MDWKFKYRLYTESPNRLRPAQKAECERTGAYPITFCIESSFERTEKSKGGKRKTMKTGRSCPPSVLYHLFPEFKRKKKDVIDFNKVERTREEYSELYKYLLKYMKPYKEAIESINSKGDSSGVYTLTQLQEYINTSLELDTKVKKLGKQHKLKEVVELYILTRDIAEKTKSGYKECIRHFLNYSNNDDLTIYDIDYNFMKKWDKWAMQRLSVKSMETYSNGLYTTLKFAAAVFEEYSSLLIPMATKTNNQSIKAKEILKAYLEGNTEEIKKESIYILPKAVKTSYYKYLNSDQIQLLKNYKTDSIVKQKAIDMFFLMYYLAGCYPSDLVLQFKKSKFQKNKKYIEYFRHKTEKYKISIPVEITSEAMELIKKYKSEDMTNDNLFNFYETARVPNREHVNLPDRSNTQLNIIGKELGFERLNCEMARHSCFNNLLEKETPFDKIMVIAGHGDFRTTRNYLDGLRQIDFKDTYAKL